MYRLDLHTHSIISYDGGITDGQYGRLVSAGYVLAVTDHNEISRALSLHQRFGGHIIVGEEIAAMEGEIIGLFLKARILPGFSIEETIKQIREQNGLVYAPHPLERSRKGLPMEVLERIARDIDIIEIFNARLRALWVATKPEAFAAAYHLIAASGSDAHGIRGIGTAYSEVSAAPTRENILELLKSARLVKQRAPLLSFLDPLRNKVWKKFEYRISKS